MLQASLKVLSKVLAWTARLASYKHQHHPWLKAKLKQSLLAVVR